MDVEEAVEDDSMIADSITAITASIIDIDILYTRIPGICERSKSKPDARIHTSNILCLT